jgi:GNAT superfamily N-acetyltransferase
VAGAWKVRRAEEDDEPFIVEMARFASTIEDRPLPPKDAPDVVAMLPGPEGCAFVATDEQERRVGAAWWCLRRPPLIEDEDGTAVPEMAMAVVADVRGQGLGTVLIEELASEAAQRFSQISLNVHLRNPAARLYTRTGFRVAGAGRGCFGVAMRRQLRDESSTRDASG